MNRRRARGVVVVRVIAAALILALGGCATGEQTPPKAPTFADLQPSSVSLLSGQEGWAVSGMGESAPPAHELHLQAEGWSRVPLDDSPDGLRKVVMLATNDGWAVGQNDVFHYDGTRWHLAFAAQRSTVNPLLLQDVAFSSSTEGWAVGLGGVLRYHQGVWADVTGDLLPPIPVPPSAGGPPYPGLRALALALASATDAWAVGNGGAIWRYDGGRWRRAPSPPRPDPTLPTGGGPCMPSRCHLWPRDGLWAVPSTRPTAARLGQALWRFANGQWTLALSLTGALDGYAGQPTLRALALLSPTEGWAAGALVHRTVTGRDAMTLACKATSYVLHEVGGQ